MIITIILIIIGVIIEKKFSPRFKHENAGWYFHYSSAKGARNKKKLF